MGGIRIMDKDHLIQKVASILGVTENMVKYKLPLERQLEMLIEQYERLEEYYGGVKDEI
jgi:hypothetical protein